MDANRHVEEDRSVDMVTLLYQGHQAPWDAEGFNDLRAASPLRKMVQPFNTDPYCLD